MQVKIYSFKDCVAEEFGNIFFQSNDESAIRTFKSVFKDPNAKLSIEDFTLYRLGDFDNSNGSIISNPQIIISGKEVE